MAYGRLSGIGKATILRGTCANPTILMTTDNILCFCDDIDGVTGNYPSAILTLPSTIPAPVKNFYFPVSYYESNTWKIGTFSLHTNGNLYCRQSLNNANICLNGLCVNLNNNFYNNTIGNNDESTMTSPITWN